MSETAETTSPPSTSETPNVHDASATASASETPVVVVDNNTTESTSTPIKQEVEAATTPASSTTDNMNNNNNEDDALSADAMAKAKKHKDRLEQNRISARESRKRKKTMIEELQKTVITMSRENKELNARNEMLRNQLMEIGTKYPSVVPIQAILSGIGAPPTMANTPTTPHIIHHNHGTSTPDTTTPNVKEPAWQEEATV